MKGGKVNLKLSFALGMSRETFYYYQIGQIGRESD